MIWRIHELTLFLSITALFLATMEAGFRLGRRFHREADDDKAHVGALQATALLLLALLLGFTFSMAVSRFDVRKTLLVDEANAIGTSILRSQFLPEPKRGEVLSLLRDYVDKRLEFYDAGIDPERLAAAARAAQQIEQRLWAVTVGATTQDTPSVSAGLFILSLNEMLDNNERRLAAMENHVPEAVIHLLLMVSTVALGFVAYGCGLSRRRHFLMNAVFAVLIALVITIILDIDRPRRGLVRVSQDSMIRLREGLTQPLR